MVVKLILRVEATGDVYEDRYLPKVRWILHRYSKDIEDILTRHNKEVIDEINQMRFKGN